MDREDLKFTDNSADEIVVVQLPRSEYKIMRSMIEREKTMSNVFKWFRTFLIVLVGGLLTLMTFGETILKYLNGVAK